MTFLDPMSELSQIANREALAQLRGISQADVARAAALQGLRDIAQTPRQLAQLSRGTGAVPSGLMSEFGPIATRASLMREFGPVAGRASWLRELSGLAATNIPIIGAPSPPPQPVVGRVGGTLPNPYGPSALVPRGPYAMTRAPGTALVPRSSMLPVPAAGVGGGGLVRGGGGGGGGGRGGGGGGGGRGPFALGPGSPGGGLGGGGGLSGPGGLGSGSTAAGAAAGAVRGGMFSELLQRLRQGFAPLRAPGGGVTFQSIGRGLLSRAPTTAALMFGPQVLGSLLPGDPNKPLSERNLLDQTEKVLSSAAQWGAAGFALGGVPGGLLGASVGTVASVVDDIFGDDKPKSQKQREQLFASLATAPISDQSKEAIRATYNILSSLATTEEERQAAFEQVKMMVTQAIQTDAQLAEQQQTALASQAMAQQFLQPIVRGAQQSARQDAALLGQLASQLPREFQAPALLGAQAQATMGDQMALAYANQMLAIPQLEALRLAQERERGIANQLFQQSLQGQTVGGGTIEQLLAGL